MLKMNRQKLEKQEKICRLIRYWILDSTTTAGSGHPTSSLSAVELMVGLFFSGIFHYDANYPKYALNDRLIFSKGHAAPLLYALFAAAGVLDPRELKTLRKFGSHLEGHPTPQFPYAEAATGSLGQGLSIGVGMALNSKYLDHIQNKIYVLLGDSELAEGQNWEAMQIASFYNLNNLVAVADINRLGQRGETMYGHNLESYEARISSFGWNTYKIDGHDLLQITSTYAQALKSENPTIILAKTIKGKGISFLEDKANWHGKILNQKRLSRALEQLGELEKDLRGVLTKPKSGFQLKKKQKLKKEIKFTAQKQLSTREAYGRSLVLLGVQNSQVVVLDAEMCNSTYAKTFRDHFPKRFFEMFIAEQNMVSTALGLSLRGKIPFISTFASFFTRAFDQIRMAQYSNANIKLVGSHVGVSIGADGPSQMGLEDIAMFRSLRNCLVLYPADAVSMEKLVFQAAKHRGMVYIRSTRSEIPVIYDQRQSFPIGGSKTLRKSGNDKLTVVAAGITLHEALKAYAALKKDGIRVRVIDLYSIKPMDRETLLKCAAETKRILTVEDHHPEGGLGEAVTAALSLTKVPVHSLSVKYPEISGASAELLDYEDIAAVDIVEKVKKMLHIST